MTLPPPIAPNLKFSTRPAAATCSSTILCWRVCDGVQWAMARLMWGVDFVDENMLKGMKEDGVDPEARLDVRHAVLLIPPCTALT